MKRLSGQFKLANETTIVCNHKNAVLADEGILNLGEVSLWVCMNCIARIKSSLLTGIMADAAKLTLRGDDELQAMLKERLGAERAVRPGGVAFTKDELEALNIAVSMELEQIAEHVEQDGGVVLPVHFNKLTPLKERLDQIAPIDQYDSEKATVAA